MSTALIDLKDRIITTTGDVALTYDLLLELARDGVDIDSLVAIECDGVNTYNSFARSPIRVWSDDGIIQQPDEIRLRWLTPIIDHDIERRVMELASGMSSAHEDRARMEFKEFKRRGMMDLIFHIDWLVKDWIERGVVWGAGRGSSCASLVLHILGLHEVDPVKYDIPLSEFLR